MVPDRGTILFWIRFFPSNDRTWLEQLFPTKPGRSLAFRFQGQQKILELGGRACPVDEAASWQPKPGCHEVGIQAELPFEVNSNVQAGGVIEVIWLCRRVINGSCFHVLATQEQKHSRLSAEVRLSEFAMR